MQFLHYYVKGHPPSLAMVDITPFTVVKPSGCYDDQLRWPIDFRVQCLLSCGGWRLATAATLLLSFYSSSINPCALRGL